MRFSLSVIAVGLGLGVSAAGAADAGSIVVRLQTVPAPAVFFNRAPAALTTAMGPPLI